jgi:hypothetical protein
VNIEHLPLPVEQQAENAYAEFSVNWDQHCSEAKANGTKPKLMKVRGWIDGRGIEWDPNLPRQGPLPAPRRRSGRAPAPARASNSPACAPRRDLARPAPNDRMPAPWNLLNAC